MSASAIVVDGYVPVAPCSLNVRDEVWALALDQRAFGPRKLVVWFADRNGTLLGIAWTERVDDLASAFAACLRRSEGAAAAIALCDEPVDLKSEVTECADRLALMREIARCHGTHLVDWLSCDDDRYRSSAIAVQGAREWWIIP